MNLVSKSVEKYCIDHSSEVDVILQDLERETHLKTLAPQMMSGRIQGQFLKMLCQWIKPKNILEIGTFTGYATICMAQALDENARITTIEVNPELSHISGKYFELSGMKGKIHPVIGNALQIIPTLNQIFDIVFIDAAKPDYCDYFDLVIDKLPVDGIILADNVLWSGKVTASKKDSDTKNLHTFNEKMKSDPRVSPLILPLRDGLSIIQKVRN